jgi:hypothetical protein
MNPDRSVKSSLKLQIRSPLLLGSSWLISALLLTFARLTHPAFGIQADLPLHYHFLRSFARSLAEGDLLPRWAGLLEGGRGDALFTFYPPLTYLIGALLVRGLGIGILTSLQFIMLLTLILAQIGAYLLAREFFGRWQSLMVSLAYVLLPAYPMIALHRAFMANGLAFSLVPLVILGTHRLLTGSGGRRGLIVFALSFSAIILTHTITTLLCGMMIAIMVSSYFRRSDRSQTGWRGLGRLAGAGMLVFALTAFFLWPQQVERDWVQLGLEIVRHDYRDYFLFITPQGNNSYRRTWADINYVSSLITVTQTLTAALLGIVCSRLLRSKSASWERQALVKFCLGLTALGLFLSLSLSDPVWRYLPGLKFVQFPWRLQPLVALACGLLAAAAFDQWKTLNRHLRALSAALLTWLIIANGLFTILLLPVKDRNLSRAQVLKLLDSPGSAVAAGEAAEEAPKPGAPLPAPGAPLLAEDVIASLTESANQIPYRPRGSESTIYPPSPTPGSLSFIAGRGRIISQSLTIDHREFQLENEEPGRARIETYYYPHWVARLDGEEVRIGVEQDGRPNAGPNAGLHTGLMTIDLPAGSHRLTLDFEIRDRSEILARWISLTAWVLFLAWILWRIALSREWLKP